MDNNARRGEIMKTKQELKDELKLLEIKLVEAEIGKQIKESSIKEIKLRIEVIKWAIRS